MAQNKNKNEQTNRQKNKNKNKKQAGKLMAGCLCSSTSLHCTEESRRDKMRLLQWNHSQTASLRATPCLSQDALCFTRPALTATDVTLICKQSSVGCSGWRHHRYRGGDYYGRDDLCLMFRAALLLSGLGKHLFSSIFLLRSSFWSPGDIRRREVSGIQQVWKETSLLTPWRLRLGMFLVWKVLIL